MNTDYNFKDEDCKLIRNSDYPVFIGRHTLERIIYDRNDFVNGTKAFSGSDKSKIINELIIMFIEELNYRDDIIINLSKKKEDEKGDEK